MNDTKKNLFLIYELEQLPLLEARIRTGDSFEVVALDLEVEFELRKRGIIYTPLQSIARSPEGEREAIECARRLAKEWYTHPELSFFEHEGILLGEPHKGPLDYYFGTLIYYVVLIEQILNRPGIAGVLIPESFHRASSRADPTARFVERLPVDVTRLLGAQKGIAVQSITLQLEYRAKDRWFNVVVFVQHYAARAAVLPSNLIMTFFQKRRPIRIFTSDPWSRIEPYVKNMRDVELVMTRRKEMKTMRWNIWRTRARFHHQADFVNAKVRMLAERKSESFLHAWDALGEYPAISKLFEYKGINFWPLARSVLGSIVTTHARNDVATIENIKMTFIRYDINCVLLFSSVKGYNYLIARVAERMDIPSIEMQHALEPTEASHPYSCLYSRYLAAYGSFTRKNYERFGVPSWRIVECGSPRFDACATPVPEKTLATLRCALGLDAHRLKILVLLPVIYSSLEPMIFTSYSIQQIIETYAALQKRLPGVQCMLRPKPKTWREGFYNREETRGLFSEETLMVPDENLRTLLALSDFVISGNSTAVLEAMIIRKPVLLYLPRNVDRDFQAFEEAGAVLVSRTPEELFRHAAALTEAENRETLVRHADDFLQRNFKFDGHSSERVSALIRRASKVS